MDDRFPWATGPIPPLHPNKKTEKFHTSTLQDDEALARILQEELNTKEQNAITTIDQPNSTDDDEALARILAIEDQLEIIDTTDPIQTISMIEFPIDQIKILIPSKRFPTPRNSNANLLNDEAIAKLLQDELNPNKDTLSKQDEELAKTLALADKLEQESVSEVNVVQPNIPINTTNAYQLGKLATPPGEYHPTIHNLFITYNQAYFNNTLGAVFVTWCHTMKVSAGECHYRSNGRAYEAEIKLSEPLLKYRPHEDLIDTLLHEMIHAYLLITQNKRDRGDHGPMFQEQMARINKIAGTKITIYHSFFAEVNQYLQYWWKCSKCGFVEKRGSNRKLNPSTLYQHKRTCDGTEFTLIKQPDSVPKKAAIRPARLPGLGAEKPPGPGKSITKQRNITSFFKK